MVSVIVPAYNCKAVLERCVASICSQTYRRLEIIIVDDGSTDGTSQLCDELQASDERIRVLHKENGGVSSARNAGLKVAQGEYVQFVDSDDWIREDMTENLVTALKRTKVSLVICGYVKHEKNKVTEIVPQMAETCPVRELDLQVEGLFKNFYLNAPWNKLYVRKQITNGFPEELSLGEDLTFNLKYIEKISSVTILEKGLYHYDCTNEASLSQKKDMQQLAVKKRLFRLNLDFCRKYLDVRDGIRQLSDNFMISTLYFLEDIYENQMFTKKERRKEMKKWICDDCVQYASRHCHLKTRNRRMGSWLIKKRLTPLVYLMIMCKSGKK